MVLDYLGQNLKKAFRWMILESLRFTRCGQRQRKRNNNTIGSFCVRCQTRMISMDFSYWRSG